MDYHIQCKLRRGNVEQVTWLPSKFAQKNKFLKLKNINGDWEDGWEVIEVWKKLPTQEVLERERDYLHQREASDI